VAGDYPSLVTAKYAICLGRLCGARLTFIHVVNEKALDDLLKSRIFVEAEAAQYDRELDEQGRRFLERVRRMAETRGVAIETILVRGVVHTEVAAKAAAMNADLLVMGNLRKITSMKEVFYDEGERIFRESPCPVLIVKNPEQVERLYRALPDAPKPDQ